MQGITSRFDDLVSQYGDKSAMANNAPAALNASDYPLIGFNASQAQTILDSIAAYMTQLSQKVSELTGYNPSSAVAGEVGEDFTKFQNSVADSCDEIIKTFQQFQVKLSEVRDAYVKATTAIEERLG